MRREIRRICAFDVSDRWIKMFRRKHGIRYFSGRRHADNNKVNKLIPLAALDTTKVKTSNFLKERRVLRTSRKEYVDVDKRVNDEINRRQSQGERLTNPWIREYAQTIGKELHPLVADIEQFFDSNWLYRFKRRYSVELKPRNLRELSPPPLSLEEFKLEPSSTSEDNYYKMLQIHHYLHLLNGNGSGVSKEEPIGNWKNQEKEQRSMTKP
ncbi:hypothetical protein CRE_09680 [Caenorhabditis remanei]|uniref:HTH CENPB-type domain-containing protein n=1 Tax=Caenorhabditis remanei TaxID=31234 RepID=E3MWZ3_CAERE|nr:hypothetical protein CRE_09680 [Caenorhabditis remanei]